VLTGDAGGAGQHRPAAQDEPRLLVVAHGVPP
jgi:hypothetical protein